MNAVLIYVQSPPILSTLLENLATRKIMGSAADGTSIARDALARQDDMSERKNSAGFSRIDASRKTDDANAPFLGSTADPGTPEAQGLYDPALRQGRLRRRLRRQHQGPQIAPDRRRTACRSCATSNTAARPARIRAWATAPAFLFRSRTSFSPRQAARLVKLPEPGEYAVGQLFMPQEENWRQIIRDIYADVIAREGLTSDRLARRAEGQRLAR